jgi:RNA polymerase sigma-70 factor (ECF subfamily)
MELPARIESATPAAADPGEPGERELVARAATDREAFAALYRRHYPAIARYVRRRVGDEGLAADLVAETFLTALEHLPRYRDRGLPFRAWLYRLATSRVHRWLRRRPPARVLPLDEQEPPSAPPAERAPVELARAALLTLAPRYQAALTLFHLEGLSVEETAAALGCRPGTVKARLSRGRAQLRRKLEPFRKELSR